jgi:hypothetical protein
LTSWTAKITEWAMSLPELHRVEDLPSLVELGEHLYRINSMHAELVSTVKWRSTQHNSRIGRPRQITVAYARASEPVGDALAQLSRAFAMLSMIYGLEGDGPLPAARLRDLTQRANLGIADARASAEQAARYLSHASAVIDAAFPLPGRADAARPGAAPSPTTVTPAPPSPIARTRPHRP